MAAKKKLKRILSRSPKRRGPGRPSVGAKAKHRTGGVRFIESDWRRVEATARAKGKSMSGFIRDIVLAKVK